MKRRNFLKTSALGTLAAGAITPQTSLAASAYNEQILVYIFLRGGIDGCNLVVPLGSADHEYYSIMRPTLGTSNLRGKLVFRARSGPVCHPKVHGQGWSCAVLTGNCVVMH